MKIFLFWLECLPPKLYIPPWMMLLSYDSVLSSGGPLTQHEGHKSELLRTSFLKFLITYIFPILAVNHWQVYTI